MEVITEVLEVNQKLETQFTEIPDYLVYETIDGNPIYYKGFKDVLKKLKTPEEIMGCSSLQGISKKRNFKTKRCQRSTDLDNRFIFDFF